MYLEEKGIALRSVCVCVYVCVRACVCVHVLTISASREYSAKCSDYYRRVPDRCQPLRCIVYLLWCACPDIHMYTSV